jgi:hypothetical protein
LLSIIDSTTGQNKKKESEELSNTIKQVALPVVHTTTEHNFSIIQGAFSGETGPHKFQEHE